MENFNETKKSAEDNVSIGGERIPSWFVVIAGFIIAAFVFSAIFIVRQKINSDDYSHLVVIADEANPVQVAEFNLVVHESWQSALRPHLHLMSAVMKIEMMVGIAITLIGIANVVLAIRNEWKFFDTGIAQAVVGVVLIASMVAISAFISHGMSVV